MLETVSDGFSSRSVPHKTIGRIIVSILTSLRLRAVALALRGRGSVILYLLQVSFVVPFRLLNRVACEFFEKCIREDKRDHGLSDHAGGRHRACVGTFVLRQERF